MHSINILSSCSCEHFYLSIFLSFEALLKTVPYPKNNKLWRKFLLLSGEEMQEPAGNVGSWNHAAESLAIPLMVFVVFLCWFCPIVSFLSSAKLYAYSTNQDCACVNHILPVFIPYVGGIVVSIAMRHNLRVKVGAGLPAKDTTGILGDLIMVCIFGYCVHCQNLRSVDRGAWDWMAELSNKGFKAYEDPCIFCIDKA